MTHLSYDEAFRTTDILNPVSPTALFEAGRLAGLSRDKTVLDLGCGKGFPSLLWAGAFGAKVEGFDLSETSVRYAEARAKMLNLSDRARHSCGDVKDLKLKRKFDVVAFLGLGVVEIYGGFDEGLKRLKEYIKDGGFLILSEPVWLTRPVPQEAIRSFGIAEDFFATADEFRKRLENAGLSVQATLTSSREEWELYVQPVLTTLHEIAEGADTQRAEAAREMAKSFEAERDAAGKYWDLILWVAKR